MPGRSAPVDRFDGWLLDLDGVVYVGDHALPGSVEAIAELRERGHGVVFVTNDPRSSRDGYASKLTRLGIPTEPADVLTSGAGTAAYVREHHGEGRTVFVVGSPALKDEMRAVGCRVLDGVDGRGADLVVVGGHAGFDYAELAVACLAVRAGAELYATNRDATFPMPDGPWPATGAIVAAVETGSGRPAIAIGKPEPHLFEVGRRMLGDRRAVAVVGDRLDADVLGGHRAGLSTILVTGTGPLPADPGERTVAPDLVVMRLADVLEPIPRSVGSRG